jgi:hypothetical protein
MALLLQQHSGTTACRYSSSKALCETAHRICCGTFPFSIETACFVGLKSDEERRKEIQLQDNNGHE